MMTEAEAKQTRCCQPGAGRPELIGHTNNTYVRTTTWWCIASECMAWRWAMAEAEGCTPLGYCGLGGKP